MNNHYVLIGGKTGVGKSMSLHNLTPPEGVLYFNCDNGKKLPFNTKFKEHTVTTPQQVYDGFKWAETQPEIHTIVIDTVTYLMDLFESLYIVTVEDGRKAWGQYAQYLKVLMSQYVASSTKNIIFLSHVADIYNEKDMVMETMVKLKGSIQNIGVESFFSNVISTKKVSIDKLESYESPLLNITEEEKELGFKHVYQTRLTRDCINERIKAPMGMWPTNETYIDNNVQFVIDKLKNYYK